MEYGPPPVCLPDAGVYATTISGRKRRVRRATKFRLLPPGNPTMTTLQPIRFFLPMLLAFLGLAIAAPASALETRPFSVDALAALQKAGSPVAVHFHADWCPTCKQQEKVLQQLKSEPGLDLVVLVADYDKEKELRRAMKVRTQSTLVVFRGTQERARLAGDTAIDKIRSALKAAF